MRTREPSSNGAGGESPSGDALERIEALFHRALGLDDRGRAALVERERRRDPGAAAELEALLAAHDSSLDFLEEPAFRQELVGEAAPRSIGPYRLEERVAEGGMGVVFRAVHAQTGRSVALKLLRGGTLAGARRRRLFQREVRVLARLQHPSIATLYEAGITADGLPWFAMEYVDGSPLDRHLTERDPDLRQRLELFVQVCEAVHHAHGHGVVPRDLKPSNVVVAREGDRWRVKVLDFGLSRATEPDAAEGTRLSATGMLLGTAAYMSPEQARGERGSASVASDVYSLGVMLFELLTGALPHEVDGLSLVDSVRRIAEDPPRRPSALRPELRGDLEAIVLTALAPLPQQRYASAAELARDVGLHLAGQPVSARPPSTAYLLNRLIRRHRVSASLLAGLFLLAVGSAVATSLLWARAARAEEAATREAATLGRVVELLHDTLRAADPTLASGLEGGRDVTVAEMLDAAAARIGPELAEEPAVDAEFRFVLGSTLLELGRFEESRAQLERARARLQELPDRDAETWIELTLELGRLALVEGDVEGSTRLVEEALASERACSEPETAREAAILTALADARRAAGAPERAEELYREALALDGRGGSGLEARAGLANLLGALGRFDEALALSEEILAAEEARRSPSHPSVGKAHNDIAVLYQRMGRNEEAAAELQAALAILRGTLGDDHPSIATLLHNRGVALRDLGRLAEAEAALVDALSIRAAALGETHPSTATTQTALASVLHDTGDLAGAEAMYARALESAREGLGELHPQVGVTLSNQARLLATLGRGEQAEDAWLEALEILRGSLPEGHPGIAAVLAFYGDFLLAEGRFEEAEAALGESVRCYRAAGLSADAIEQVLELARREADARRAGAASGGVR